MLLVVNPQFSASVGKLVLNFDVHHGVSDFFGDWENRRSEILHFKRPLYKPEVKSKFLDVFLSLGIRR